MSIAIKRLGPGDEAILDLLANEDADFDLEGRSAALPQLKPSMAQRYLANPGVLHWVAMQDGIVTGFLYCAHVLLRCHPGQELLLYEIGVGKAHRRKGVGRALLDHMARWMQKNEISVVWVCADNPVAVDFYRGCGFAEEPQPVYMTRTIDPPSKNPATTTLLSRG
ncbi:MAG TPA: GNAT family N-acetyltransferase [Polyangiaceae bacterium]|nr:GNAT family N-acetyltransferase [Polyangiaceae bacterium]